MSRDADRLLAHGEIPARCVAKVDCRVACVRTLNTFLNTINRLTTNRTDIPRGLPIGSKVSNILPHSIKIDSTAGIFFKFALAFADVLVLRRLETL